MSVCRIIVGPIDNFCFWPIKKFLRKNFADRRNPIISQKYLGEKRKTLLFVSNLSTLIYCDFHAITPTFVPSGSRSSKTFKPKKNIPEGSHQHDLMKHAAATLGSGKHYTGWNGIPRQGHPIYHNSQGFEGEGILLGWWSDTIVTHYSRLSRKTLSLTGCNP